MTVRFKNFGFKLCAAAFAAALTISYISGTPAYADKVADDPNSLDRFHDKVSPGGGYAASGQLVDYGYSAYIYNESLGLPTSDNTWIMEDDMGFMWFGSYSGVVRYDGISFDDMGLNNRLTNARCIFQDSQSRIWVGTNDNGVVVLDNGNIRKLTELDGLTSTSIRAFAEDPYGEIYVGSTAGVSYVDSSFIAHPIRDSRLTNERILKLETSESGRVIGQSLNGSLYIFDKGKVIGSYTSEDLGFEKITTFLLDPDDSEMIYIGTNTCYIYHGKLGDKISDMKKISVAPIQNTHWLCNACGRIWVSSTSNMGFLDKEQKFNELKDLPMDNSIEMITSDYQGNIWVASSTQGIMKIVASIFTDIYETYNLEKSTANAICRHNGMLFIGTDNGIELITHDGRSIENSLKKYIGRSRVRCITKDSSDNIWLSTYSGSLGLVCYRNDGSIKSYNTENGMPSNLIRCTSEASDGRILVGTNGGLVIIKDMDIERVIDSDDNIDNTIFTSVVDGPDGVIYAGTDGDGIYVISDDSISVIDKSGGLTSDVISRIVKDDIRGLYWIITSNSIQYMQNGKLTNVSTIPISNNYDILFNNCGYMWVLSSRGIYSIKVSDVMADMITDYTLYSVNNGLPAIPTSYGYSYKDQYGSMYIATRDGVTKFNANKTVKSITSVKIALTSIYCNNDSVVPDSKGVYTLPSSGGRIQINPAVLDFTLSDPLVRMYLEGAEDEGITVKKSSLTALEYTGLKYGDYKLHIQILDDNTLRPLQDEIFLIKKAPQFYELFTAKIIFILFALLIAGVIIWRAMMGNVIRKQYEEVVAARDEAQRANLAKSRFLANMSHEIRTPINTIMGMNEMILRENANGVPQDYFLSIMNYSMDIQNASESLLGIINDLLDISKIESGKMHLVEQPYDISDMLRTIIPMVRVRSDQKSLNFEINIDETIPVRLYGDGGKIKQVLLNLLTNASKYTNSGGFTLKILVSEKTNETVKLRMSVKDTGIGIKEEDLGRLFDSYERLDEEKNSGIQGTGLGLDISKRFAELMNGELWCESVYGQGSEFIFVVEQKILDNRPIGPFVEHDNDARRGPYIPQFIAPDASVLVVDDNAMNLEVIKGLLKATKMFVTTAESGEECLERIKYGHFDIVLLDHMMPGMDGIETLARIREDHPDLPVYALTANSAAGEDFYIQKGFTGYLSKPIDTIALEHAILTHLPKDIVMQTEAAEGEAEPESMPEELSWLSDLPEISVEEGIKNAGGVSSYVFALHLFYDTIDSTSEVIENAYNEGDIKLYTVKVHALKTSARIIGSSGLSKLAESLENAGNKNNMAFIDENTPKLLSDFRAYKEKFARLNQGSKQAADAKPEIPSEELKDAYNALMEVVPSMDYDSVEMIIDQLLEYTLPSEDAEIIDKFSNALKQFDWDTMEALTNELKQKG